MSLVFNTSTGKVGPSLEARKVKALERIADSLEKLTNEENSIGR